jgi:hypothetical protein
MISYIYSYVRIFIDKLRSKFIRSRDFQVGYSFNSFERNLSNFVFIKNPDNGYYADPFISEHNGNYYIFCEFFDNSNKKGHINVFVVNTDQTIVNLGACLKEDTHLSFPYIIRVGSNNFLIPESKAKNAIALYKCVEWPLKWEQQGIIIDNVSAVDSLVFYSSNLWWLFTTKSPLEGLKAQSELHLYYSDSLNGSEWSPHPLNPVVIDSYYGRNAGLVNDGTELIRCSQANKKGLYGSEVNFHKIIKLTINEYQEVLIDDFKMPGCHSFDSKFGLTVVDRRT